MAAGWALKIPAVYYLPCAGCPGSSGGNSTKEEEEGPLPITGLPIVWCYLNKIAHLSMRTINNHWFLTNNRINFIEWLHWYMLKRFKSSIFLLCFCFDGTVFGGQHVAVHMSATSGKGKWRTDCMTNFVLNFASFYILLFVLSSDSMNKR